jgi:hypothetical protein
MYPCVHYAFSLAAVTVKLQEWYAASVTQVGVRSLIIGYNYMVVHH